MNKIRPRHQFKEMINLLVENKEKVALGYLLLFLLWCFLFFYENHFLPAPFFFDKYDTLMDFFNVNWWANTPDFYTKYKSIYTPINAYLGKLLTSSDCMASSSPFSLRGCDVRFGIILFCSVWVLNSYLLFKILGDITGKIWWVALMMFSFPMMFAMERGNYIMLGMVFTSLWVLMGERYRVLGQFILTLVISIKLGMFVLLMSVWIRDGWKAVLAVMLMFFALLVIFGLALGDPHWTGIPSNMFAFQGAGVRGSLELSAAATTPAVYAYILRDGYGLHITAGYIMVGYYVLAVILTVRAVLLIIHAKITNSDYRLIALVALSLLMLLSTAPGYYSLILLFPFLAHLLGRGELNECSKFFLVALCLPYPVELLLVASDFGVTSFLSDQDVLVPKSLTLQGIISPLLLLGLYYGLTKQPVKR